MLIRDRIDLRGYGDYEVDVGTTAPITHDFISSVAVQTPSVYPSYATAAEPAEPATDWSSLINVFTSFAQGNKPQQQVVQQQSSVPDWVWLAVPIIGGALFLTIAVKASK